MATANKDEGRQGLFKQGDTGENDQRRRGETGDAH